MHFLVILQDLDVKATVIKAKFDLRISATCIELIILKGFIYKALPVQIMVVRTLIVQGLSHARFILKKVSRLEGESRHHRRTVYIRSSAILIELNK